MTPILSCDAVCRAMIALSAYVVGQALPEALRPFESDVNFHGLALAPAVEALR